MRKILTSAISSSAIFALSLVSFDAFAQNITRGPYLQQGAPTSIILRWQTDVPVATRLEYGTSQMDLSRSSSETNATRDHEVQLSSLRPHTRYYYRVVAQGRTLVGGDEAHYFVTSPDGGDEPFRVWVVGDAGISGRYASGSNPGQLAVRESFLKRYPVGAFQLFMMLGDNAYESGTDAEYQRGVFNVYPSVMRSAVTWSTQGNHDKVDEAYYNVFSLPQRGESGGVPSGTEFYYSFDYGNVHFISLNSDVITPTVREGMLSWLRRDLAENHSEWTVAFWHHPPYSKGSHDSDYQRSSGDRLIWMRENALPILESAGVDLVLSGHSHGYERSKFMRGHYGESWTLSEKNIISAGDGGDDAHPYVKSSSGKTANSGTVYVVAGNAGEIHKGVLNHPAMVRSLRKLGSLSLSFDANELVVEMVGADGGIEDTFIIRKDPTLPRAVRDLAAKLNQSGCEVGVSWSLGVRDESYAVYRSSEMDGRGIKVGTVSAGRNTLKDSIKGLTASTLTYSVRASNSKGSGPWGAGVRVALPSELKCR